MIEAAFPLLGTAIVFLVALPVCALAAKAVLLLLERNGVGGELHGLTLRYLVLVASSALPIAWLLSAGVHQVEGGKSVLGCILDHGAATFCFEPGYFSVVLALVVLTTVVRELRRQRAPVSFSTDAFGVFGRRVDSLVGSSSMLEELRGRVEITDEPGFALGTFGLLRPRVVLGRRFGEALSDAMLVSALGHEAAHVRALDPLRYLVLQLALAVNPLGRGLLEPHTARWRLAREAHCDREAVVYGAAPLSLAEAIVKAARPNRAEVVALGSTDVSVLKLRVELLLAFSEEPPHSCCANSFSAFPLTAALLFIAALLPHQTGTAALDALHLGTEHAFSLLWR